jgi:ribonuclease HI
MTNAVIYTDGGARGNPGPAGIGYVIYDADQKIILLQKGEKIGEVTNNFAEYTALIRALTAASKMGIQSLVCYLDSELVVKQLLGKYKVREESLKILAGEVIKLTNNFTKIEFKHVPREKNSFADKLVNDALDQK